MVHDPTTSIPESTTNIFNGKHEYPFVVEQFQALRNT